eukprot:GAFH01002720.1.p6 GENE.GAFH01002720.1~~GAFH01002720.1.p6  ORF type:complete len:65 (+),score=1.30 GAFH01002720.1:742-936(+)
MPIAVLSCASLDPFPKTFEMDEPDRTAAVAGAAEDHLGVMDTTDPTELLLFLAPISRWKWGLNV